MLDLPSSTGPRFFIEGPLAPGAEVDMPDRVMRHVAVLRLQAGDSITLFDGSGGEYGCTLSRLTKTSARARVIGHRDIERESGIQITLALGLSGGDRMDLAIQKATELGVCAIHPFAAERSVVRLSDERASKRLAHWRHIVAAACEQCGRNRLPEVHPVAALDDLLQGTHAGALRLLLSPGGAARLRELAPADSVLVLIGPEGGLSDEEQGRALRSGFTAVRFGPRVLRTETAPLAAIAALQAMWGDA